MKKKLLITAVASISLAAGFGTVINQPTTSVVEAKTKSAIKYSNKFYKVRVTKKTAYYKVIRGRDEAHNKYKKMGYLKPGKIVYVRARGVVWGWTIGKTYKYCSFRDSFNHSWFTTNLKKKSKKHVAKRPTTQKARHPKLSAKGVGKTTANNTVTTNTNVLSTDILNQLNDSSLSNISKFKLVLSLSGAQRKAADKVLMKQLGLYNAGKPVVSTSKFEKTLKEQVKNADEMSNWINSNTH